MNYRHAFHAGNFADVAKHLALISVLLRLRRKTKPFAVIDTHGGRGVYDLASGEAGRTNEAEGGIRRLAGLSGGPEALTEYLKLAGGPRYPGSPLIAAGLLRRQDRLVAVEKHPEDFQALAEALAPFARARAACEDGYARLIALLPPPERRAAILIDPPFEAADEFETCARAFAGAFRRFATGVYLIWFPLKAPAEADRFCGEVLDAGAQKALRLDIKLNAPPEGKLAAAGLLVVNPPYGFAAEMREAFAIILPHLDASANIDWLAGGE
jgi:23S rRNA (adenine2030-N6)-methyltransferase